MNYPLITQYTGHLNHNVYLFKDLCVKSHGISNLITLFSISSRHLIVGAVYSSYHVDRNPSNTGAYNYFTDKGKISNVVLEGTKKM